MKAVYHAGTQGRKVRALAWLALAALLGGLWGGADALADGDAGGAALFAGMGGLFLALIVVFLDHYAAAISIDFKAGATRIDTPRLIGHRRRIYRLDDLLGAGYEAGESYTIKHHVRAPYVKLRVRGRRWPFIIDMQGRIADAARFQRLLSGIGAGAKKK